MNDDHRHPVLLTFGLHAHQPVGNFDYVIEDAYQKSYRPFLEVLHRVVAVAGAKQAGGFGSGSLCGNRPGV